MPRKLSKSRVILVRRKSGKTSFVQRIFNQLWSANGQVIPFYLDIADKDIWYPTFAIKYYRAFASQYISFLAREERLVRQLLSLAQIRTYGVENGVDLLVEDVDAIWRDQKEELYDLVWETASTAPQRYAAIYNQRFLVILDEFQNIAFPLSNRKSELSETWAEYLRLTFNRVNGVQTKHLMLYLNKHDEQYWTPRALKRNLKLELSEEEIYERLVLLAESDVILRGVSDIQFRGLQDGTLNLILRHRFEEKIEGFETDFKAEFQAQLDTLQADKNSMRGRISYLEGMLAERLLAIELRSRKHFRFADYFMRTVTSSDTERELNVIEVQERVMFQRTDGKTEEIDIIAKTDDERVIMVEVRKHQEKTGLKVVTDLRDNALAYAEQFGATVLPASLSLGGFTEEAKAFCTEHGIGRAEEIAYYS